MRITVIGLGEAGAIYASALTDAGHTVTGFDPGPAPTPEGTRRVDSAPEAVTDADLVLVLTSAAVAPAVAEGVLEALTPQTVYADFTSATPDVMRAISARVLTTGARFADVAILGPMTIGGATTDLIVSGPGAPTVAQVCAGIGADVEALDGAPGEATARKLLRSSLMKPLAAVVCEAVVAGRAAGAEEWVREQVAAQLTGGEALVDRFLSGTVKHAGRRSQEVRSTAAFLDALGVPNEMTRASEQTLLRLEANGHQG
ncbi:NAD(P)-dependent oxidoreductase [Nocardiopsis sp. MG754419]|uniref:NAD(P)-dependent oxidoreductase n=1 Tax=Nocardiopsis sp. MG754419 TaxID=2259865 RepID=UPI001BA70E51|nr:NAD(P)-dependent oxidoreductase [Nocardiopsis sp. MG754419]MBR8742094.1 NAD(P)-dependent oxidoreductase [Nocardiopsis sp. MG754419]